MLTKFYIFDQYCLHLQDWCSPHMVCHVFFFSYTRTTYAQETKFYYKMAYPVLNIKITNSLHQKKLIYR